MSPPPDEGTPAATLLDQIAAYLAGTRDPTSLDYRHPNVTGLGSVRCGVLINHDPAYYLQTLPTGTTSLLMLSLAGWYHTRLTLGPHPVKARVSRVQLDLFVVSGLSNATAVQEATYGLVDRIAAYLDGDPSCGTGGTEAGGMVLGEATPVGAGAAGLTADFERPTPLQAFTQQWVHMTAAATQYIQA